ncbi:unnamed protein product, partial [Prorocentrum cordatum]
RTSSVDSELARRLSSVDPALARRLSGDSSALGRSSTPVARARAALPKAFTSRLAPMTRSETTDTLNDVDGTAGSEGWRLAYAHRTARARWNKMRQSLGINGDAKASERSFALQRLARLPMFAGTVRALQAAKDRYEQQSGAYVCATGHQSSTKKIKNSLSHSSFLKATLAPATASRHLLHLNCVMVTRVPSFLYSTCSAWPRYGSATRACSGNRSCCTARFRFVTTFLQNSSNDTASGRLAVPGVAGIQPSLDEAAAAAAAAEAAAGTLAVLAGAEGRPAVPGVAGIHRFTSGELLPPFLSSCSCFLFASQSCCPAVAMLTGVPGIPAAAAPPSGGPALVSVALPLCGVEGIQPQPRNADENTVMFLSIRLAMAASMYSSTHRVGRPMASSHSLYVWGTGPPSMSTVANGRDTVMTFAPAAASVYPIPVANTAGTESFGTLA